MHPEFNLHKDLIYLNHAAVSPWPLRTKQAVCAFAEENTVYGARNYPHWINTELELRRKLKKLINAYSSDDIALLKNTSEALSVVAFGLDWQVGDNVVITDLEFPSNRIVWESLISQGVEIRYAPLANSLSEVSAAQSVIELCDNKTRIVSVSSVQYTNGLRLNLKAIGEHCKNHHVLFCVDAIQSIGALQFDVQNLYVDFAMADGHKWMLGPEGLALFYCRPELRQQLKLHQYGWHMTKDYLNFDQNQWQIADSARRFECGSPNMLGIHALNASLSLILEIGVDNVETEILNKTRMAIDYISNSNNLRQLTPEQSLQSGIISFTHNNKDVSHIFDKLTNNNIVCALRGGGVRFSPHFYTPDSQLLQALEIADNA